MKLEILGSGGAVTTPRPFCTCPVCRLARQGSAKDGRLGPSVFVHGPDLLIDTPEEISVQLNRSTIQAISACTYSHWHPDHTSGKRVFEMNKDWVGLPPANRTTPVYLTEKIAETFGQFLGLKSHFDFLDHTGLISRQIIGNSQAFFLNSYQVRPIQLTQDYSFGYEICGFGQSLLVIMDELKHWQPDATVLQTRYDLVYLPLGIVDVNPLTGTRNIHPEHPILADEQTLAETLDYVRRLSARQFILSHIEEPDGISLAMGQDLGEYCSRTSGKPVQLAYDTLLVEI